MAQERPQLLKSQAHKDRPLASMLAKNPSERPTVHALREHPWVTRNGTQPMEVNEYLPFEITDDDIQAAVKRMGGAFAMRAIAFESLPCSGALRRSDFAMAIIGASFAARAPCIVKRSGALSQRKCRETL